MRLDRVLAVAARGRLAPGGAAAACGRRRHRRRRGARAELPGRRREELEFEPPERAEPELRPRTSTCASPGRTSTCSSSTSRRASSSTRRPATRAGRSSTGCSSTAPPAARRSGPASSTGSTATRPACSSWRARRRSHRRLQRLVRRHELERTYLALVRGRPRSWRGTVEAADRPRPLRADAAVARHRHAARRRHALRGRAPARRPRAAAGHSSRRAARTRFACTWPRSTCPCSATGSTACLLPASGGSSCTPPGSRSRTRSRASGSTSSRRCRTTSAGYLERLAS